MNTIIRRTAAMLCMLICLFTLTAAQAAVIDPEAKGSMTLTLTDEGAGVADVTFSLYRVASMDEEARLTLMPGWRLNGTADLNRIATADGWKSAAEELQTQAMAGKAADYTGKTDAKGTLTFTQLPLGLYLVIGKPIETEERAYVFAPYLISVPGKDAKGAYVMDVTAEVKYEASSRTVDLRVLKVWEDKNSKKRPASITVDLYCDGEVYTTVTLSSENNWQYTFEKLSRAHVWVVVEREVPKYYNVSYKTEPDGFVITNTAIEQPTPPPVPQTGLTWWPVPLLAGMGAVLFLLGLAANRSWRRGHEKK